MRLSSKLIILAAVTIVLLVFGSAVAMAVTSPQTNTHSGAMGTFTTKVYFVSQSSTWWNVTKHTEKVSGGDGVDLRLHYTQPGKSTAYTAWVYHWCPGGQTVTFTQGHVCWKGTTYTDVMTTYSGSWTCLHI